jgi:glutamate 5-kinase
LPVGIKSVDGGFGRGEVVECVDESGKQIALGLANYNAEETKLIIGLSSDKITSLLGYINDEEFIHRDNIAIV